MPRAPAVRLEGKYDPRRACLPTFHWLVASSLIMCLSVPSLILLKSNPSTLSPVSNELDIQGKCLQKRSREGGGISLTAPALPAPAFSFKTRDQDSCPSRRPHPPPATSHHLQGLSPASQSVSLPTGPTSFPCCYPHWPPRTKDLVPSSTMRRSVANLGDSYFDIIKAGICADREKGKILTLWLKPDSASMEGWPRP